MNKVYLLDWVWMGGYAPFVWSSYGLAVLVLLWNVMRPLRDYRSLQKTKQQEQL